MATIWVVAEIGPGGSLARISAEGATLARALSEAGGFDPAGIVVGADPAAASAELAAYLPRVVSVAEPKAAGHAWAMIAAERVAEVIGDDTGSLVIFGAGPDGRDAAGALSGLTGRPVLVNATAVVWTPDGPTVEMSVFGGKLTTISRFAGTGGLITLRPNAVTAEAAGKPGAVEAFVPKGALELPLVDVVEHVAEAAAAAPIEEARIIVSGGRGVGGQAGFELVASLAESLGGAVGASRAAVDAGWIPYAQQIGQTGKIVRPQLYLALGISGAIQHKVGMQTAETIVAVNRDPDAPIAEFADLVVVGDLFDVVPALMVALASRTG